MGTTTSAQSQLWYWDDIYQNLKSFPEDMRSEHWHSFHNEAVQNINRLEKELGLYVRQLN